MNCRTVHNQLLILEDPGRPPAAIHEHLQECDACRQWQQRLLQVERCVPRLPVPASQNQQQMIRRFLDGDSRPVNGRAAAQHVPPPILSLENSRVPLARLIPRYRLYAALAVAAALFVLVFDGLLLLKPDQAMTRAKDGPKADPFLASLLHRNLRLAKAQTPRKRLETLVDLADDLQAETRKLVRGAAVEDLQELAHLFEQVVEEGIVRGATGLPADQRREILAPAAERLARAGRDADHLAQEAPDGSANALRVIAAAARHGGERLRALMRE